MTSFTAINAAASRKLGGGKRSFKGGRMSGQGCGSASCIGNGALIIDPSRKCDLDRVENVDKRVQINSILTVIFGDRVSTIEITRHGAQRAIKNSLLLRRELFSQKLLEAFG
jgi:hypothetical protein